MRWVLEEVDRMVAWVNDNKELLATRKTVKEQVLERTLKSLGYSGEDNSNVGVEAMDGEQSIHRHSRAGCVHSSGA